MNNIIHVISKQPLGACVQTERQRDSKRQKPSVSDPVCPPRQCRLSRNPCFGCKQGGLAIMQAREMLVSKTVPPLCSPESALVPCETSPSTEVCRRSPAVVSPM
ncbi:hypothetical protein BaRGS_00003120 [Batillaria attramentaria]|uniref:Uncharacterized protein n=1 Tax=Batillaria attramentaria TaxID=370345 RepID=A0ABD0M1R1_9CAEN